MDVCKQPKPGPVESVGATAKTDRVEKGNCIRRFLLRARRMKEVFFSFVIVDPSTTFLPFLIPWFLGFSFGSFSH